MKKLICTILLLTLLISSCVVLDKSVVPLNEPPERPELSGTPVQNEAVLMQYAIRYEIWGWYAKLHNGEISKKEYKDATDPLFAELKEIEKAVDNAG